MAKDLDMSTAIRKMGSFRSYVGLEEYELKNPKAGEMIQPDLLPGELVISEAANVLICDWSSKRKGMSGKAGSLFVTNARVIFISSENRIVEESVPLLSISMLWYYENSKGSTGQRGNRHLVKLGPSSVNSPTIIPSGLTRVHEVLMACSTFRMLRFSFKFSPIDHGVKVCNAIIHHSFPEQFDRIFYFDYMKMVSGNGTRTLRLEHNRNALNVPSYLDQGDWLKELNMTKCAPGYRITSANENFELCGSLPEWIVVPADLIDVKLRSLARKLKGHRPPHWSWANSYGAGILRMSKLNNEDESSAENAFFEMLRKTHPEKRPPRIVDLDKDLPAKEVKQAFSKLFDLCCPESYRQLDEMDSKFLSQLEQTRWMTMLSKTLNIIKYSAGYITDSNELVIFQEHESRDSSCLCSSLVQILVEPRFRTITGFFTLIQKEWIAFGHPFRFSYMHASPFFLLFLDGVFQLMKQNIVEFEFNDRLLLRAWEQTFDTSRGTFLFDTPQQRKSTDQWKHHSAWELILKDELEELTVSTPTEKSSSSLLPRSLVNPLYKLKPLLYFPKTTGFIGHPLFNPLSCWPNVCDLTFWSNLYFRSLSHSPRLCSSSISKPVSPLLTNSGNRSPSLSPSSSSPSPHSPSNNKFSYPTTSSLDKNLICTMGRNPETELAVVEHLLSTLSASTKINRYIPHARTSRGMIGDSSRSNSSVPSSPSSGYPQIHLPRTGAGRKNPFTHL